jgi:hypothetical protein
VVLYILVPYLLTIESVHNLYKQRATMKNETKPIGKVDSPPLNRAYGLVFGE